MKESMIEKTVSAYARGKGWLTFKFSSPGQRAVPDRLYIKNGLTIYIEFKRLGKKPTKLQLHTHEKMREKGAKVYVVDNVEQGKEVFSQLC
jgi:hypothetical protein